MKFSQFQRPQHHLPLWLPALRDFILHFVLAQWHGSNFTLPRCFLNNSVYFVLVLIDFTPLILNGSSFILSKNLRHLTSHYFCSIFHDSFVPLPMFSHPCLWSHWAKVLGMTKLTSLFCNSPPALPSLTCKMESNSQPLLKSICLKIILLTFKSQILLLSFGGRSEVWFNLCCLYLIFNPLSILSLRSAVSCKNVYYLTRGKLNSVSEVTDTGLD